MTLGSSAGAGRHYSLDSCVTPVRLDRRCLSGVGEEAEAAEVGAEVGVDLDPDDGDVRDEDLDRLLVGFLLRVQGDPLVADAGDGSDVVARAVGGEELDQRHRAGDLRAVGLDRAGQDGLEEVAVEGRTGRRGTRRGRHRSGRQDQR